jgi:hypothetical protein
MFSRRTAWIAVGALVYSALALAVIAPTPMIESVVERLPVPLLAILLGVVGPVLLFAADIEAWPVAVVVVALIAICLGLARLAYRKSPETEWFVFWLLSAAVLWAGSALLLAVAGI